VSALKKLNVPYLVSLPLVFQTTEEWLESELGVHPVQVALQVIALNSFFHIILKFHVRESGLSEVQVALQVIVMNSFSHVISNSMQGNSVYRKSSLLCRSSSDHVLPYYSPIPCWRFQSVGSPGCFVDDRLLMVFHIRLNAMWESLVCW
jgi:hypothetical protein